MKKNMVLFSGGKDSFYILESYHKKNAIDLIVTIHSPKGDTHFHAGPEMREDIIKRQLELIGIPNIQIEIGEEKDYLHQLFLKLKEIVKKEKITHLVTGDLWHPYTSGIGDMLVGALGIEIVRPARERCPSKEDDFGYMNEILDIGINSIIISVRKGDLPRDFVGREINKELLEDLKKLDVGSAGESGEYQSFVLSSPIMNKKIIIDKFNIELVEGKNKREEFYRMNVKKFDIE